MNIFLTIVSGVLVFVFGQIVLKLVVEPWQQQRDCIGRIAHTLVMNADVYANPGVGKAERMDEVKRETRALASDLIAICRKLPAYGLLARLKMVPEYSKILAVQKALIGLSNTIHQGTSEHNDARVRKIRHLLGIEFSE